MTLKAISELRAAVKAKRAEILKEHDICYTRGLKLQKDYKALKVRFEKVIALLDDALEKLREVEVLQAT